MFFIIFFKENARDNTSKLMLVINVRIKKLHRKYNDIKLFLIKTIMLKLYEEKIIKMLELYKN